MVSAMGGFIDTLKSNGYVVSELASKDMTTILLYDKNEVEKAIYGVEKNGKQLKIGFVINTSYGNAIEPVAIILDSKLTSEALYDAFWDLKRRIDALRIIYRASDFPKGRRFEFLEPDYIISAYFAEHR